MARSDVKPSPVLVEVAHCPLCGAHERRLFDRRTFRGQSVTNQVCARCGFVFQSPRMSAVQLDLFYEEEYRQLYQGAEGPSRKDMLTQAGRAESLLAFLPDDLALPARLLDIGSSAGMLIRRFQERFGTQVIGVEPGNAYRAYAQGLGFTVYPSLESLQDAGESPFDMICMAHVLEHLPDPAGYLTDLRSRHLTPGGRLLVEVPNLYAHNSFEVAHLAAYSPHTLEQMLKKAGYEVLRLRQHGQPRSVALPLYLTLLARPLARPPDDYQPAAERAVALKRRWGLGKRRVIERLLPDLAWLATP
jgi:2-polyprenyl-3-methyl-5-hydroxy-6-metoxy-1,4-benzoquinol methylase